MIYTNHEQTFHDSTHIETLPVPTEYSYFNSQHYIQIGLLQTQQY